MTTPFQQHPGFDKGPEFPQGYSIRRSQEEQQHGGVAGLSKHAMDLADLHEQGSRQGNTLQGIETATETMQALEIAAEIDAMRSSLLASSGVESE